jgi:hypothetical protein
MSTVKVLLLALWASMTKYGGTPSISTEVTQLEVIDSNSWSKNFQMMQTAIDGCILGELASVKVQIHSALQTR